MARPRKTFELGEMQVAAVDTLTVALPKELQNKYIRIYAKITDAVPVPAPEPNGFWPN